VKHTAPLIYLFCFP